MSMLHLLWIVPLVAAVAWGFGYKANPERVRVFVKKHIVDEDPYQDEGHSATRYAPESGESPIAREARKAAEVGTARPGPVEVCHLLAKYGDCQEVADIMVKGGLVACRECPGDHDNHDRPEYWSCLDEGTSARRWLLDHGIPIVEVHK